MTRLNIGLIGCGSIALSAHIPALAHLSTRAQIHSVCDVRANVAQQTAERLGITKWSTNYLDLLADPQLDVVVITTPEFLHAEQVIAAAQAGKHILCEKPIATTLVEADDMISATEDAGVLFMVAHSRRFTARYQNIRQILDQGAIGSPILIRENERRPRAQYAALQLPVDVWQPEPGVTQPWKDLARYSGGVARGHAIHEMDLFRWFAGSEARTVTAESKITLAGREVPDAIAIQVEFANGILAGCDLYSQAPSGYPYYHQLEIIGTDGILRARDTDMITLTRFDGEGMHFPAAYHSLLHVGDAYITEHALFYDAIEQDIPVPLDPSAARAALELALAATASAESGVAVDLPLQPHCEEMA